MNKRICFIVHNFSDYGGVGVVAANLANAFSQDENVFMLSLISDDRPKAYHLDAKVKYCELIQPDLRLRDQMKELYSPVRSFFRDNEIDVAIILGHWPAFLISAVKPFVKTKFVYCDHGALMNQWEDKKNTFMRWIAAVSSDCTVALTKRTRDDYIDRFHLNMNKVRYIYNWIEIKSSDSDKYDINSKRFISAGRFGYEKGFDRLIEIVRPVFQKYQDWHLDIFGDGEMLDVVEQRVKQYNLESNVHLMGKRDNLRDCFKQYAFYVLPSFREGLPIVLLEAKCNKLPIISFDVLTGPSEIISDNVDGLLIKDGDNDGFSNAICTLIEDKDLRMHMSDCSSENLDKFDKMAIFNQWRELINSL